MNSILRSLFDRFGSIRSAWQLFLSVFCQISSLISMPCLLVPLLYITTCLMLVNHVCLFSVTPCLPILSRTFFHSVCSKCYLWGWYLSESKSKTELNYWTKLQIQSQRPWTLHGIIKLVISLLIFDIIMKKWEDIVHFRSDKERYQHICRKLEMNSTVNPTTKIWIWLVESFAKSMEPNDFIRQRSI